MQVYKRAEGFGSRNVAQRSPTPKRSGRYPWISVARWGFGRSAETRNVFGRGMVRLGGLERLPPSGVSFRNGGPVQARKSLRRSERVAYRQLAAAYGREAMGRL